MVNKLMMNKLYTLLFLLLIVSCKTPTQKKINEVTSNIKAIENNVKKTKQIIQETKSYVKEAEQQATIAIETMDYKLCPIDKIKDIRERIEIINITIERIDKDLFYLEDKLKDVNAVYEQERSKLLMIYKLAIIAIIVIYLNRRYK